jgi:hypothetical protein
MELGSDRTSSSPRQRRGLDDGKDAMGINVVYLKVKREVLPWQFKLRVRGAR